MNGKAILNCIYSAVLGGVVTFFVMDKLAESRESKNDAYWLDEYNKREAAKRASI